MKPRTSGLLISLLIVLITFTSLVAASKGGEINAKGDQSSISITLNSGGNNPGIESKSIYELKQCLFL